MQLSKAAAQHVLREGLKGQFYSVCGVGDPRGAAGSAAGSGSGKPKAKFRLSKAVLTAAKH